MWQIGGFYSSTGVIPITLSGANLLLTGEHDALAIDATTENGTVSVNHIGVPANNLSNVAISASNLTQSGTSPKHVIWNDGTIHTISAGQVAQEYDAALSMFAIFSEPAATNVALRSEAFDAAEWNKASVTITADNITAPDGNSTADKWQASATGGGTTVIETTGHASGTGAWSASIFIKAGTATWCFLAFSDQVANAFGKYFDLTNGVVGSSSVAGDATLSSSTITSIGSGWYRIAVSGSFASDHAGTKFDIRFTDADNSLTVTSGKNGYIWGAQLETGAVASSYIPTLGTAVTRAADVIKAANTTFPWSDTNGSIYIKYKPKVVSSGSRYAWQAYKDANNHISLLGITADPTLENTQASTQDVAIDAGTLVANTLTRISGAYKANDFDVSQDGAAVQSDAGSTLTTGYTDLYIGTKGSATGEELNGYIYQLLYVPYQRQTVNGDLDTWKNGA